MDTGNFLHIVITVIAIIGAGAVALVCDMLKSNNERLREANLELQVRREEEQRRAELAIEQLKRLTPAPAGAERALPPARLAALTDGVEPDAAAPTTLAASSAESPHLKAIALDQAIHPPTAAAVREPGATLDDARKLARNFLQAVTANGTHSADIAATRDPAEQEQNGPVSRDGHAPVAPDTSSRTPRLPRRDWDRLLKGAAKRTTIDVTPRPHRGRKGELIPFESLQLHQAQQDIEQLRLPSGLHRMAELNDLIETNQPLHGLVMSIALNDTGASDSAGEGMPSATSVGAAGECVRSMLHAGDFAGQWTSDQFLIISPCTQDLSQRRLVEMTERLWDFQLRADLASGVILSWGSYEATGEAISSAVASAKQRMEENRRSRTAATAGNRRRAV